MCFSLGVNGIENAERRMRETNNKKRRDGNGRLRDAVRKDRGEKKTVSGLPGVGLGAKDTIPSCEIVRLVVITLQRRSRNPGDLAASCVYDTDISVSVYRRVCVIAWNGAFSQPVLPERESCTRPAFCTHDGHAVVDVHSLRNLCSERQQRWSRRAVSGNCLILFSDGLTLQRVAIRIHLV